MLWFCLPNNRVYFWDGRHEIGGGCPPEPHRRGRGHYELKTRGSAGTACAGWDGSACCAAHGAKAFQGERVVFSACARKKKSVLWKRFPFGLRREERRGLGHCLTPPVFGGRVLCTYYLGTACTERRKDRVSQHGPRSDSFSGGRRRRAGVGSPMRGQPRSCAPSPGAISVPASGRPGGIARSLSGGRCRAGCGRCAPAEGRGGQRVGPRIARSSGGNRGIGPPAESRRNPGSTPGTTGRVFAFCRFRFGPA